MIYREKLGWLWGLGWWITCNNSDKLWHYMKFSKPSMGHERTNGILKKQKSAMPGFSSLSVMTRHEDRDLRK